MKSESGLQESFLQNLCDDDAQVTIYLINGVKLQGALAGADERCLFLRRDDHMQLIYKHAVSTVLPSRPQSPPESGKTAKGERSFPEGM